MAFTQKNNGNRDVKKGDTIKLREFSLLIQVKLRMRYSRGVGGGKARDWSFEVKSKVLIPST